MIQQRSAILSLAISGLVCSTQVLAGQTYYVSTTGNDNADGLTPATAWSSLDKVSNTTFAPGSEILFQRGGEWRGQLSATSDGTAEAPIVYGAYGDGAKPKFWGSDVVPASKFNKIDGTASTYQLIGTAPNALLANHQFLRDASLYTNSNDPSTNYNYVKNNPGTWASFQDTTWVNTGGINPSAATFTAAMREDVVFSNRKDNLVFRDLVVDESAKREGGYAFRVQESDNVRIENSEAYRAGKHHVGVISSDGFVAQNVYSSVSMPGQGFGGATAYVAFSDGRRTGDDSTWIDCVAENLGDPGYGAFYNHGSGLGNITLQNMVGRNGAGIGIVTEGASQNVKVLGGQLDNSTLQILGNGVTVDGMRITGEDSLIDLRGSNNTVQNVLMTGTKPEAGYYAAVMDQGVDNTLQFNTIVLDPDSPYYASALAVVKQTTNTKLVGNIFDTPGAVYRTWAPGYILVQSDMNMFSPDAHVIVMYTGFDMNMWRSWGFDEASLLADPAFVNAAAGDFSLTGNSLAVDRIALNALSAAPLTDFFGTARPAGAGLDLGALEVVPEPGTASLALLGAGAALLRRGRRR